MSGICLACGTDDAGGRVRAMLADMDLNGARTAVLESRPDLAAAKSWDGRLPAECTPAADADGLVVLVDGEIYDEAGIEPDAAAVIARLYRKDALDRVAHLNGSFAAVIVDPARNKVTLATDRLGSRTLFVWHRGQQLAAATGLASLLADDRIPRRLSVQGLAELLTFQRTVLDHTQYADVQAMPAAQVWTFENGALLARQTRRLAWARPDFTEAEGAERLGCALRRAVARRTADRARHGLLLSGGLDSRVVLAAARAEGRPITCITTASHDNAEVAVARAVAAAAEAPFRFCPTPPSSLADRLDGAIRDSDGLFPAPANLYRTLRAVESDCDVLLSGHGLDYTFRGYYLPCVTPRLAGSATRLPRLRSIGHTTGRSVAEGLRVGIGHAALAPILRPDERESWQERGFGAIQTALGTVDIEDPYDSWDAFILHCLGRHYAYSDFVAMEKRIRHRTPTFDTEVFDLYLAMPPAWRAKGRMAHAAMNALGPDLMMLSDANTGYPARYGFWRQMALVFVRAAARKAGLAGRPEMPEPVMTPGSWADLGELLRNDSVFLGRLRGLTRNSALMDTGLFDRGGLGGLVDDHVGRRANHKKLLYQLLSVTSWLEQFGYSEVVHGD